MAAPLTWDAQINGAPLTWDSSGLTWDGELPATPNPINTMPNDNRISQSISPADKAAVLTHITAIRTLLPWLINLTKTERIAMPKLGPASLAFDEHCKAYMASTPNLVPPFVDVAEVNKDRALRLDLADIIREAKKLCEALDDTRMVVGSEIWMADLSFYQTTRQAARRDIQGADAVYDDLRARFPGTGGDAVDEEENGGTNPTPPVP